jgi:hypothetical protein
LQAALNKIPSGPVTLSMRTVSQSDKLETFTLCTLDAQHLQQQ